VCPHTLSNRSVIVNMDSVIEVTNLSERLEVFLSADGQVQLPLVTSDVVRIRRADEKIRLVRLPGSSFFNTLRKKLNWSGSSI
jgi:NAD+ kinase